MSTPSGCMDRCFSLDSTAFFRRCELSMLLAGNSAGLLCGLVEEIFEMQDGDVNRP